MERPHGRERWIPWIAWALAMGWVLGHSAYLQPWTLDDAYISFRYAEHWAQGLGPVYNAGERVEGYTTFLWVALLALGARVGLNTVIWAKVLGTASAAGALAWLAGSYRASRGVSPWASALAVLLAGTSGLFSGWVMSGMEVSLLCFTVWGAFMLHLRSLRGGVRWACAAGVFAALAAMTRPDALLVGALLLSHHGMRRWRRRGNERAPLAVAVAWLGVYVSYFLWRWKYYGWLLPNTFYAKVGHSADQVERGLSYLGGAAWPTLPLWGGVVLLLAGAGLAVAKGKPWPIAGELWVLGAFCVLHGAYVVSVGGDVMPAWRFLTVLVGPLALLGGVAITQRGAPGWWGAFAVWALCFSGWQSMTHRELHQRIVEGNVGRHGVEVGRFLADTFPAGTWLATNTAGSVPYASRLPTIDMLGLNDEHIAHVAVKTMGKGRAGHEKADGRYVLSRAPALIQFGSARGRRRPVFPSDRQLSRLRGFKRSYVLQSYQLPSGAILQLWVRRSFLKQLEEEKAR